ncbi:MAG: glycosyltransferase [bacterium]|jgi:glycosyltransferase involved in cell wall biosynthesis
MSSPLVSVVMSVKNGGESLRRTIESILQQDEVDLEFIIIDDGSTDITPQILEEARCEDERITVLKRSGRGLTISLIEGCDLAKGEFIARQDANDYSLPGRLSAQANQLIKNSSASICSTRVRFITKEGISVFTSTGDENDQDGLSGIIHGSVMMRRSMYLKSGGYRQQFYFAQDVDLWSRLFEYGSHVRLPQIYYEGLLFPDSISGSRKLEQAILFNLIKKASKARKKGEQEDVFLEKAAKYSRKYRFDKGSLRRRADGAYFIGSCLIQSHPELAKEYLQIAISSDPTHLRARLRLAKLK